MKRKTPARETRTTAKSVVFECLRFHRLVLFVFFRDPYFLGSIQEDIGTVPVATATQFEDVLHRDWDARLVVTLDPRVCEEDDENSENENQRRIFLTGNLVCDWRNTPLPDPSHVVTAVGRTPFVGENGLEGRETGIVNDEASSPTCSS